MDQSRPVTSGPLRMWRGKKCATRRDPLNSSGHPAVAFATTTGRDAIGDVVHCVRDYNQRPIRN